MKPIQFEFATATRILFGTGKVSEAGRIARTFGSRALLVTGSGLERASAIMPSLREQGIETAILNVCGEPDTSLIERGVELARAHRSELVLGIGGGSVIDTGKAIAALLGNPGELLDYLEVVGRGRTFENASVPCIAIPTTAGTGAEVTRNSVLAVPSKKVKVSLRSPHLLPRLAIVDPELTYDLPAAITAYTGLDALTQLIEAFVCSRANPLADALCREGIGRAARALPVLGSDLQDKAAREDMALASLFGGLALANAGLGAVHGLAGPIGGMFPAPHGAICAALLPLVMRTNLRALSERAPGGSELKRYGEVAGILTGNPHATAEEGIAWVARLTTSLRIPPLRNWGIEESDVPEIVSNAVRASSMKANPILLSTEEVSGIMRSALAQH